MIFKKMFRIIIFFIFINLLAPLNANANSEFNLWVKNFKIEAILDFFHGDARQHFSGS